MSYRGGSGGGGGTSGGAHKRQGRPSPYARNGGGGGGHRRSWGNQPNRKRESSGLADGPEGRSGYESTQKQETPVVPGEMPPTQPGEVVQSKEEPLVASESPSMNNSTSGKPLENSRTEKKSLVKSRLFVGNLPRDMREPEVKVLFEEYGEVNEVFVQKDKGYGFVRMVYRSQAENAVANLNGKMILGREVKVRFAASNSSVKVSNLHHTVSNELLFEAFSQFGEVEKAVVVTDEKGKSLGHGIVDFSRKMFAQMAIRRCTQEHFLLTQSPMPVIVAEYMRDNDEDGLPEKAVPKNNIYRSEREGVVPRFADPGSLEYAVASQWKMTYESEKHQRNELEQQLRLARHNVVQDMDALKEQHRTELIRQELAHHQQEQLRLVQELRLRQGNPGGNMPLGGGGGGGPMMGGGGPMMGGGGFMEQPGGSGGGMGPGFHGGGEPGADMRNAPLYENPPLIGAGPPAVGGLLGVPGTPPVPIRPGGPGAIGGVPEGVSTSTPQSLAGIPPPPLMGQWSGGSQGTPAR